MANGPAMPSEFLPLKMDYLTNEMKLKARNELGETEEKVRLGVQAMKKFIEEGNLPIPKDDFFLLTFLRGQKFRLKDVQEVLKNYVSIQRHIKDALSMDFDTIKKLMDHKIYGLLPIRDEQGRVIVFFRGSAWSPEICEPEDVSNCAMALVHFAMQFPPTSVCGYRILVDASVSSLNEAVLHYKTFRRNLYFPKSYPVRFQKMDFVNENAFARFMVNTVRRLFSGKIYERMEMHGKDKNSLFKASHPSIVPEEFGGNLKFSYDSYINELKEHMEKYRA